jgi:peptidyl-prolyl cis-trans isomerase SurA
MIARSFCVILCALALAGPAAAQGRKAPKWTTAARIAAVVNNNVITVHDMNERIQLILLTSRIPNTAQTRHRLAAQVLRTLINESLQLQEAKRLRIGISDREVATTLADIEKRNHMPRGGLFRALRARGVDPKTLVDQVRAGLAWSKVIRRAVRRQVRVSDGEIDDAIEQLSKNKNRLRYKLSEIFLAVDGPGQDAVALRNAKQILTLIRRGAAFGSLARQFSQSATAAKGGDMGVVFQGQLEPELEKALKRVRTGQVIGPIKTNAGYYILLLRDRRTFVKGNPDVKGVTIATAAFMPQQKPKKDKGKLFEDAKKLGDRTKSCRDFVNKGRKLNATRMRTIRDTPRAHLPAPIRAAVAKLKAGQVTPPIPTGGGYAVYMNCRRAGVGTVSRDEIWRSLLRQKMSIRARQYMRDLRRAAFVDIRV